MKLEQLDDYLTGALGPDEDAFEEDLFEAAARGEAPELAFVDRAFRAGRQLHARGTFSPGVRRADLPPGVPVITIPPGEATIELPREAELLVFRFEADTRGLDRVDLEVRARGRVLKVMGDLPFTPGAGEVLAFCEGELARAAAGPEVELALVGIAAEGRRELGAYRSRSRVR